MDSAFSWLVIMVICIYCLFKFLKRCIEEQEERKRQSEYYWNMEGK